MTIQSSAFTNASAIPKKYTCRGENINPPLAFGEIPAAAKSLALIMDDPDAPSGTFTHWVMWNIAVNVNSVAEHSVPEQAKQGANSSGEIGYMGPCPPSGTHRYFFKLFALDEDLEIEEGAKRDELEHAMAGHIIGQAELMGTYQKE